MWGALLPPPSEAALSLPACHPIRTDDVAGSPTVLCSRREPSTPSWCGDRRHDASKCLACGPAAHTARARRPLLPRRERPYPLCAVRLRPLRPDYQQKRHAVIAPGRVQSLLSRHGGRGPTTGTECPGDRPAGRAKLSSTGSSGGMVVVRLGRMVAVAVYCLAEPGGVHVGSCGRGSDPHQADHRREVALRRRAGTSFVGESPMCPNCCTKSGNSWLRDCDGMRN